MEHYMKLDTDPFDKMKSGVKTIELRLLDEKRKRIRVGDTIIFTKLPDGKEKLTVEVVHVFVDKNFHDLIEKFPISIFGYKNDQEKVMLIKK